MEQRHLSVDEDHKAIDTTFATAAPMPKDQIHLQLNSLLFD